MGKRDDFVAEGDYVCVKISFEGVIFGVHSLKCYTCLSTVRGGEESACAVDPLNATAVTVSTFDDASEGLIDTIGGFLADGEYACAKVSFDRVLGDNSFAVRGCVPRMIGDEDVCNYFEKNLGDKDYTNIYCSTCSSDLCVAD
ncbi:hypothetical protein NQ318_006027 [Aromia moschata]|uniref:Uncharacterized protein n=1 Tax=Aromia moschata TaxID=1265417 RepID=A0AAV8Z256_9CUCU|nr:hypothetical protein NQ318_006027 [Aromia moschata]